jgi:hypothetical protein
MVHGPGPRQRGLLVHDIFIKWRSLNPRLRAQIRLHEGVSDLLISSADWATDGSGSFSFYGSVREEQSIGAPWPAARRAQACYLGHKK